MPDIDTDFIDIFLSGYSKPVSYTLPGSLPQNRFSLVKHFIIKYNPFHSGLGYKITTPEIRQIAGSYTVLNNNKALSRVIRIFWSL